MAYYNKIGLLILNDDQVEFLVCEPGKKYEEKSVTQYLMPGGQLDEKDDIECLRREIKEELDCDVDINSVEFVSEYTDMAASGQGRDVLIRLYKAEIIGKPKASSEIGALVWIGKKDINNPKVSPIIKNKIIPDLIKKGILK